MVVRGSAWRDVTERCASVWPLSSQTARSPLLMSLRSYLLHSIKLASVLVEETSSFGAGSRCAAGLVIDLRPEIRSRFPNPPNQTSNLRFDIEPLN